MLISFLNKIYFYYRNEKRHEMNSARSNMRMLKDYVYFYNLSIAHGKDIEHVKLYYS